jgi:hypothetical protein
MKSSKYKLIVTASLTLCGEKCSYVRYAIYLSKKKRVWQKNRYLQNSKLTKCCSHIYTQRVIPSRIRGLRNYGKRRDGLQSRVGRGRGEEETDRLRCRSNHEVPWGKCSKCVDTTTTIKFTFVSLSGLAQLGPFLILSKRQFSMERHSQFYSCTSQSSVANWKWIHITTF